MSVSYRQGFTGCLSLQSSYCLSMALPTTHPNQSHLLSPWPFFALLTALLTSSLSWPLILIKEVIAMLSLAVIFSTSTYIVFFFQWWWLLLIRSRWEMLRLWLCVDVHVMLYHSDKKTTFLLSLSGASITCLSESEELSTKWKKNKTARRQAYMKSC